MREAAQLPDRHVGELVLLALHHIRKAGVIFEYAEVELGNDLAARPVPDAKLRLDQPAADHLVDEAQPGQHFQGRGMGGRGAWTIVDAGLRLQPVHRDTLARQRQRGDASDRPTAGNQYGTFRCRHLRTSVRATGWCPPTKRYRQRAWR